MSLFSRTVAFTILVVALNQWLKHHLGFEGVANDILSLLLAVASGVATLLDKRIDESNRGSFGKKVSQLFGYIISVPVLACLYLMVIFIGLSYSSVSIIGSFDNTTNIEVESVGREPASLIKGSVAPDEDTKRFGVWTYILESAPCPPSCSQIVVNTLAFFEQQSNYIFKTSS
jgi:hypothetical protein